MAKKKTLTVQTTANIYLRVSTARQASDGVSLDAQESKCRAHCERMGWTVVNVFKDEGISGKDGVEHRAGLKALLEASKPEAVTVVYSISRLARRQRLLWNLLDDREGFGLSVSSATEAFDTTTPTGRAMLGMIAVFAQLESDMVSERTKDALAELKTQGVKLGQKSIGELAPEKVSYIKALYASGRFSQRGLVHELNSSGYETATGKGKWHLTAVQAALKA